MKKKYQRKYSKVTELPFYFGVLSKEKLKEIKERIPNQPSSMDYRKEFIKGRGASTKDRSWNKEKHLCCGSLVAWRHKASCKRNFENGNLPNE